MRVLVVLIALVCVGVCRGMAKRPSPVSGSPTDASQPGVSFGSLSKALVRVKNALTSQSASNAQVVVSLCGDSSCCAMFIRGYYNNSLGGFSCKQQYSNTMSTVTYQLINDYSGPVIWEPKDMSLIIENEYQLLGVRLESSPDSEQMWVQCPPDAKFLNVYSTAVGSTEVNLFNGQDFQKVPDGPVLQLGELVFLNVTATYSYYSVSYLSVGLCGGDSCAAVWISYYGNSFSYQSGLTESNMPDSSLTTTYQNTVTSSYFPTNYKFNVSVALHPDRFLQVWTPSDQTSMVLTLPVPDSIWNNSPSLKILFPVGYVTYQSMGIQERVSLPNPYESLRDQSSFSRRSISVPSDFAEE